MSIASIRFATHSRTWLLIAALTALLIGIGALLGGAFLYLFPGLTAAMNVIGYWFSDRLALKASRAQPVEPGAMSELEGMVQDLAQRAQVPAPQLYMIPSDQPNAFATGRNPQHATVAVTEGLVHHLPPDQVKSVLAHEFAHIKNRDILVSSIAAMVAGAIAAIANIFPVLAALRRRRRGHRAARLDRTARDDHRRAAGGVAAPARRLAPARVPRRRNRGAVPSPRRAARRRPRDAGAQLTSAPDQGQPGNGVALRRQPSGTTGCGDALRDASTIAERVRRLRALDDDQALGLAA